MDSEVANRMRARMMHQKMFELFFKYRTGANPPIGYRLPLAGRPPEVYIPGMDQTTFRYHKGPRKRFNIDAATDRNYVPARYVQAWERVQELKKHFITHHPRLRYRKCLGWGGNGLASVFDDIDENGRKVKSYVAKVLFRDDEDLLEMETDSLREHIKAEHIVQLLYRDGEGVIGDDDDKKVLSKPDPPPSASTAKAGEKRKRSEDDDGDDPDLDRRDRPPSRKRQETPPRSISVFITEMLENGDLFNFICSVNNHRERVPNAVLWRFLLCLVRMCIAMAYPPACLPRNKGVPGPITETVLDPATWEWERRMVHFDFDPTNIFVGDLKQGVEHQITPLLKLGDFGLATEILYAKTDDYYERFRYYGKRGFYAPEQFCADWDYIREDSGTIHTHPIAGHYGIHTNVWAVGYVMEALITLCYPAEPPKPTRTNRAAPEYGHEYWTYGAHLEQERYSHVDPELISVVLRCQAHFPLARPKLHELEELVLQVNQDRYPDEEVAGETLPWIQKILHEPPMHEDLIFERVPVIEPSPPAATTTEEEEDEDEEGSSNDDGSSEAEAADVGGGPIRVFQGDLRNQDAAVPPHDAPPEGAQPARRPLHGPRRRRGFMAYGPWRPRLWQ